MKVTVGDEDIYNVSPEKLKLGIFKTHPDTPLPVFSTTQAACFDLVFSGAGKNSYVSYDPLNYKSTKKFNGGNIVIDPKERVLIPTGLIFDIPKGYSVRIHSRSGISLKQGIVLVNGEAVIDSDYTDETMIIATNISAVYAVIRHGDRIAQAELVKDVEYTIQETKVKPIVDSNRTGGFGSTGL